MTECEYIDATNLAKVRAGMAVLRDYLCVGNDEEADKSYRAAMHNLCYAEERLSAKVKTKEA